MIPTAHFGQQFLLQAPQPQFPGMSNTPFVPTLSPPPLVPAFSPQSLNDQLSLSNPPQKMVTSDEAVESSEPPVQSEQPDAIKVGGAEDETNGETTEDDLSDDDSVVVEESTTIDLESPVLMNLKTTTTTNENFTVLSGQDIAEMVKAAGPELLQKIKGEKDGLKHHKKEETDKEFDKEFDGEKNIEPHGEEAASKPPATVTTAVNPFPSPTTLPPSLSFMPQVGAFNILA